uniref:Reverse transcriptase domain-containing protein n=1 Tax=Tanacetum cinerariifolium TaxID=118510 RepID=A0A6L2LIN4_TANCI|nr:reverse transcriptase domain-containing protein [Tanacetum cinerariifolium]
MNQEQIRQVTAHDEKWVPVKERVKISTTNVRLETTVAQKEETFQVIIDVIKNSTCYKAFTSSAEVPKIFMQQFSYTVKKKILDIFPRVQGVDFANVLNDEATLTFLISLGYKGPLQKHLSIRVVKKKVTITAVDNIIPIPDITLEIGKSISLIEATEEEAARQVHATHARIMTEPILEPAKRRPSVMSDSKDSTISYTTVSSPFGGLSDIGSPGVDGPPVMPEDPYAYVVAAFQAPPSPNYVSGPEYPPLPEFVPKPVYPKFMPTEDDILPTKEQPLPTAASPTTESPGYIDESDLEDDPEEVHVDYPADGGDKGDDEDESSDDDEDDDIDIEEDEYLAPANSTAVALPAVDHAPSAEETKLFETDELMAIPTPPPSPLSLLSSPLPQIPSPPLPLLLPPPTDPTYEEAPLGYRATRLRWRAEIEEIPKADLSLRKRLCTTHTGTYELGESSAAVVARLREPVRDDLYRLFRDKRFHAHTARLMKGEAKDSRTALIQSMDASDAARFGVIALRTQVSAQRTEITDLRAADRRFQTTVRTQQEEIKELRATHRKIHAQFIWVLTALKSCQSQLTVALGRIQILEAARVPAQPEKMAPKRTTRANPATTTTTTTTFMTDAQLEALIEQGVAKALATRDADRNTNSDDSHVSGTDGIVFRISNCSMENQIKFSTYTLLGSDLAWWNSHVMTVGPDAAYAMTWVDMKKKMTDKYCPRGEMKKLKSKLWNLRVKSNDVVSYSQRFQELALLCVRMFPEEEDKIERYVGGLPDLIYESVVASRPKTIQEAIEMANELMGKRNNTWAERQAENKRKVDDTSRSNQSQQQQ